MKIDHLAIYARDLEGMRNFFETYFGARANQLYHNPQKRFRSYFLTFEDHTRLEIMTKEDVVEQPSAIDHLGLIHFAFNLGSKEAVDVLTKRFLEDGYSVLSGPRVTGDGYYESCVLGFENIQIELTV